MSINLYDRKVTANGKVISPWSGHACFNHIFDWHGLITEDYIYEVSFKFKCTIEEANLFKDELNRVFDGLATVIIKKDCEFIVSCPTKIWKTYGKMYGILGAARLVYDDAMLIKSWAFFHTKYKTKLSFFQKMYLAHLYPFNGYYEWTNHEYLCLKFVRSGRYSLKYFKSEKKHIDRWLTPEPMADRGMSAPCWPAEKDEGDEIMVQPLSAFTTIAGVK